MALSPQYWSELEQAGVRDEHLRMLVLMLRAMGNGRVTWFLEQGQLRKCEMAVFMHGKPFEVQRVGETVFQP